MKATFFLFFVLYVFLLITLVLFDKYFGRVGFSLVNLWKSDTITYYIKNSFNIIPFKTIYEYFYGALISSNIATTSAITNIFGNLIAFTPFSFFLPLLFNNYKSFKKFIITMLIVIIMVEILQFVLLTGSCDIDDVILNLLGACIAYKFFNIKIIKNVITKITTL
jgi:glycopeptide antibiotics resistance protein